MKSENMFMAYCGVYQWTRAVVDQAKHVQQAQDAIREILTSRHQSSSSTAQAFDPKLQLKVVTALHTADHFFLISCHQMLEYSRWARAEGCYAEVDFSAIDGFGPAVRDLRNMREHVIEYFKGEGHYKKRWIENGADASSRVGNLIGGRLDYLAVTAAATELLGQLDKTSPPTSEPDFGHHGSDN